MGGNNNAGLASDFLQDDEFAIERQKAVEEAAMEEARQQEA